LGSKCEEDAPYLFVTPFRENVQAVGIQAQKSGGNDWVLCEIQCTDEAFEDFPELDFVFFLRGLHAFAVG